VAVDARGGLERHGGVLVTGSTAGTALALEARAPAVRDRFTERFTVQANARRMADLCERMANGTPMAEVRQT
jgi:hypothetical protein